MKQGLTLLRYRLASFPGDVSVLGTSPVLGSMARLMRYATMAEAMHSTATRTATRSRPTVLVIAGTTAVGKTDLSLELSKILNGEIISADSVQVYSRLDIGSAKVDAAVRSRVPHHLLDVASITEQFSAGDYYRLAMLAVQDVISRGRVPLVVGGTGLYLHTLIHGPTGAPCSTPESRASMDRMLEGEAWETSLERLKTLDPDYAASLLPNDWYRLKRALEICTLSGKTVTSFKKEEDREGCLYEFKCLFLSMPRVQLFQRIDTRCEAIIEQGLFPEVISLVGEEGLVLDSQAGRSVGYRQALEFLSSVWGSPGGDGGAYTCTAKVPRDKLRKLFMEFLSTYQAKTRQLAHKQLVWFKKEPGFHWLNVAPAGQRLPLAALARAVAQWFTGNSPLPEEWDGRGLQELTAEEKHCLTEYSDKHSKQVVFSDMAKVESILQQIEAHLQGT